MEEIKLEVEARRVCIANDSEKLTNGSLSDITYIQNRITTEDNHNFCNSFTNANNSGKATITKYDASKLSTRQDFLPSFKMMETALSLQTESINFNLKNVYRKRLCRMTFEKWRSFTKNSRHYREKIDCNSQKLTEFLKTIEDCKNRKLKERRCRTSPSLKMNSTSGRNSAKISEPHIQSENSNKIKTRAYSDCFEHRLKAQQSIILHQKCTIVKQEKLINELKLGKLSDEINKSLEETEKEIQQALLNCSAKLKYKKRLISSEDLSEEMFKFHLNTIKAPKVLQQMERRALERQQKRQIIMERKKLLSQLKKEAVEREIERKNALTEEERKRSIKEIKERRKKELEIQQRIQLKKKIFLQQCIRADNFYERKLKKIGFSSFVRLMIIKENNEVKSVTFYERNLKMKGFQRWIKFISNIYQVRIDEALYLYNAKLKHRYFKLWLESPENIEKDRKNISASEMDKYQTSIQHLQVAEDLYDLTLQSKTFIYWHRYTCTQYVLQIHNMQKAQRHYNSRILFHYFYQWKSLPVVIRLEKAKEEKKRRWREKVWEVLADFTPIIDD